MLQTNYIALITDVIAGLPVLNLLLSLEVWQKDHLMSDIEGEVQMEMSSSIRIILELYRGTCEY